MTIEQLEKIYEEGAKIGTEHNPAMNLEMHRAGLEAVAEELGTCVHCAGTGEQVEPTPTEIRYLYENALSQIVTLFEMNHGAKDSVYRIANAALMHDFKSVMPNYIVGSYPTEESNR